MIIFKCDTDEFIAKQCINAALNLRIFDETGIRLTKPYMQFFADIEHNGIWHKVTPTIINICHIKREKFQHFDSIESKIKNFAMFDSEIKELMRTKLFKPLTVLTQMREHKISFKSLPVIKILADAGDKTKFVQRANALCALVFDAADQLTYKNGESTNELIFANFKHLRSYTVVASGNQYHPNSTAFLGLIGRNMTYGTKKYYAVCGLLYLVPLSKLTIKPAIINNQLRSDKCKICGCLLFDKVYALYNKKTVNDYKSLLICQWCLQGNKKAMCKIKKYESLLVVDYPRTLMDAIYEMYPKIDAHEANIYHTLISAENLHTYITVDQIKYKLLRRCDFGGEELDCFQSGNANYLFYGSINNY